jgi:hypothetical protein
MLSADDMTQMQADLDAVRGDNTVSVTLRRGDATLEAQTVRIAGGGLSQRRTQSGAALEIREQVVLLGATILDVQIDDRFTLTVGSSPVLYRVTWVRPERRAATMAKAEAIE